tara:strand:- start:826 stop:1719 length:894 start_codon:yes stop_codon:yes gene_type:complete
MVKKVLAKLATRGSKKVTKKKRPVKKELERQLDLERAKRVNKEKRKEIRAKAAADKKKVKKKASTQKGMIGSGARSAPGKGAKNPRAKDAEPMRAMSDELTAFDDVSTGQAGRINTGKSFNLESMRTASQRKRAKEYARIDSKDVKDRTSDEKKFHTLYEKQEAERSLRADMASSNTQRAKNKKRSEKMNPEGKKRERITTDDAGDPVTGEFTDKTTAKRLEALERNAAVRARIDADRAKTKSRRDALKNKKPEMMYGGMANNKKHMYAAGGSVKDNPGLKALAKQRPDVVAKMMKG